MLSKPLLTLALVLGPSIAAELPRKAPEFAVQVDGKPVSVSSFKGKVLCLAFILTTCPHCQKTTQVLSGIEQQLGPKGLEVLEAAINPDPNIPTFINQFHPAFPVGTAGQMDALGFMQISLASRPPFLPYIAFIDRKGMIRNQLTGSDTTDEAQTNVLRGIAEKLLAEPAPPKHRATH